MASVTEVTALADATIPMDAMELVGIFVCGLLRQRVKKWGAFEDVLAYALLRAEYLL